MKYDTATPYIASYVLLRNGNKIAFVLRENTSWMNGYYGLPSGKVEDNEPFMKAAVREAKEEVGIDINPANLRHSLTVHRRSENTGDKSILYWVDVYFEVDEWHGEVKNTEPELHSEVAWLDLNNLPANIIPSVRFALEQISAGNSYCEYGW